MAGSLGIALGGFASGLSRGMEIGSGIQEAGDRRRERRKRSELEAIDKQGAADYAASGSTDPYANFYNRYVVPKKVATLLKQGDVEGANAFQQWADSSAAREGGKLFSSGVLKGQSGDIGGAIKDFVKAGGVQGYGADWKVGGVEELDGGAYRVQITGPDGEDLSQVFKTPEEVMRFGATHLNPEAAYKTYQDQQAKKAEVEADVYKAGKIEESKQAAGIRADQERARLGIDDTSQKITQAEAQADIDIESEQRRRKLGLSLKGQPKDQRLKIREQAFNELKDTEDFFNADAAEQKRMIDEREAELRQGMGVTEDTGSGSTAAPPARRKNPIVVDTATGKVVDAPAPSGGGTQQQRRAAPADQQAPAEGDSGEGGGLGDAISTGLGRLFPRAQAAWSESEAASGANAAPRENGSQSRGGGRARPANRHQAAIESAYQALKQGAAKNSVRFMLRRAEVPMELWPREVK